MRNPVLATRQSGKMRKIPNLIGIEHGFYNAFAAFFGTTGVRKLS